MVFDNMEQFVFLKETTYYNDFLRNFYKKNNTISNLCYDDHFQLLMEECFGWSNFFQKNLNKIGYNSFEIVLNDEVLQKKWAREHNKKFNKHNWFLEILLLQINYYDPNIIIWEDPALLTKSTKKIIENQSAQKILHIGHFCSLCKDLESFKNFELVIGCSEYQQNQLKKVGVESIIFRHAFEPSILDKIEPNPRSIDVTFIGSVSPNYIFSTRYNLIEHLLKKTDLEIWTTLPSYKSIVGEYCAFFYNCIKSQDPYHFWANNFQKAEHINWKKKYPTKVHPGVYGIDMFRLLAQSKITLNCHGDAIATGDAAANMRLYEATGMGALLITDWKKNLSDLFEPDKEIITYKTPEECVEKIQYYLEHDKEREAIARAGQKRTLKEHTYFHRMKELKEIIKKHQ
jgi:hypothetical protein